MRWACVCVFVVLGSSCGVASPRGISDTTSLLAALRGEGASVRPVGVTPQSFMPVAAQLIAVDGAAVQVFELPDEASARALAAVIAPDGSRVGRAIVEWPAPPHFYRAGRAIVLYVGDDAAILARLRRVMGDPIASGPASCGTPDDGVPTQDA